MKVRLSYMTYTLAEAVAEINFGLKDAGFAERISESDLSDVSEQGGDECVFYFDADIDADEIAVNAAFRGTPVDAEVLG